MTYKVIIIDDEQWTREVIKSLGQWEDLGLEVVGEASDGESGLELIRQLSPDIILTDVRMPLLNGIDLVALLKQERGNVFVIIISGYDDYEYVRSALKLGVTDYLLKPVKMSELNNQLQHCTELLENQNRSEDGVEFSVGFLDTPWADEFYLLLDGLHKSLCSSEHKIIEQKFAEIELLIEKKENGDLSNALLICIYYTLMHLLQEYIAKSGYVLKEVFTSKDTSFVFSRESTFAKMIMFTCELYCYATETIKSLQRAKKKLDIAKIQRYAEEHYAEGITLEQTASQFYISKEHLSKLFKSATGDGFSEYITKLRMKKAKELILTYKIPLKEVGSLLGYLDQAHFYKTFKKFYGKTPGEMQNELKIDNKTGLE